MSKATDLNRITIRKLGPADAGSLRRLAERDSAVVPRAEMLGAERDGQLIAAISLDGRELVLADPFWPSGDAVELLRIRHLQIAGSLPGRARMPRLRPSRRAQAALAGSPPGGGTRLLRL